MRAKERLPGNTIPEFKNGTGQAGFEEEGSIAVPARKHDVTINSASLNG